jgi:hypothetical protein
LQVEWPGTSVDPAADSVSFERGETEIAIDQRDAAGELADFGEKLTRPLLDHRSDRVLPSYWKLF